MMQHYYRNLIAGVVCLMLGTSLSIAQPQPDQITIEVRGLACPFCVYGLEKHLRQVDGVASVETSLAEGKAIVTLEPGKEVSDEALREAVRRSGFNAGKITRAQGQESSPEDQRQFTGKLVETEDQWLALKPGGSRKLYFLFQGEKVPDFKSKDDPRPLKKETESTLRQLMKEDATVAVTGSIHHHTDLPPALRIRKFDKVKQ